VPQTIDVQTTVREFLANRVPGDLSPDDDIFRLGFVNSMFALQLVMFVEKQFGITVDSEDLELDNFRSLSAIAGLVERKVA
jgi:acyl carrier protein